MQNLTYCGFNATAQNIFHSGKVQLEKIRVKCIKPIMYLKVFNSEFSVIVDFNVFQVTKSLYYNSLH